MGTSLTPTSLGVAMSSWLLIPVTVTLLDHVRYMKYSIVGRTSVEKTNNNLGRYCIAVLIADINYKLNVVLQPCYSAFINA